MGSLRGAFLGVLLLGCSACTNAQRLEADAYKDDAIRTVRIYDLLRALPRAKLQAHPGQLSKQMFSVNDELRPGVFLHPSGSIVFPPLRLSAQPVLSFKIGVVDDVWDKTGDGAEFIVSVRRMNDASTTVFSRYLDPKHNPGDRQWFDEKVPLRQFADMEVRILLATTPGPAGDTSYDWAVFAEPQILLGN
jgi:hypothetical protein